GEVVSDQGSQRSGKQERSLSAKQRLTMEDSCHCTHRWLRRNCQGDLYMPGLVGVQVNRRRIKNGRTGDSTLGFTRRNKGPLSVPQDNEKSFQDKAEWVTGEIGDSQFVSAADIRLGLHHDYRWRKRKGSRRRKLNSLRSKLPGQRRRLITRRIRRAGNP